MNNLANTKKINLISGSGYSSTTSYSLQGAFDTQGFTSAAVLLDLGINTASASFSAALQHSDTNGSFTTIAGSGLAFALPNKGEGFYVWNLDLRGSNTYDRWINLKVDLGYSVTGLTNVYAVALLGDPEEGIIDVTGNGAVALYEG